jgi:type VI protein secretion system component VasK
MWSRIFALDNDFYVFSSLEYFKNFSIVVSIVMCIYMMVLERLIEVRELKWFNDKHKRTSFCGFTLFLVLSLGVFKHQTFIYFQF